jgi:hypothetical protein
MASQSFLPQCERGIQGRETRTHASPRHQRSQSKLLRKRQSLLADRPRRCTASGEDAPESSEGLQRVVDGWSPRWCRRGIPETELEENG